MQCGPHTAAQMSGANQRLARLASQVQGYPHPNVVAAVRNPWQFRDAIHRAFLGSCVCWVCLRCLFLCACVQSASAAYKAKNAKVLKQIGAVKVVPVIALDRAEDAVPLANALK